MSAIEGQIQTGRPQATPRVARVLELLRSRIARLADRRKWPSSTTWHLAFLVVQGLIVFAVGFGYHAYLAPYGVDPHHDGIMFKPALDVSQGKMVFRDTFTQYGGVTVLLQAAALKLFGARLLVIKLQTALTYGLVFTVFWRAWSRLIPSGLAVLICLVGTVLAPDSIAEALPWSSVFALLFQGLTLLWAMRYLENGRELELVFSGAAAALAFWCRQPVGVFLAVGMLGALAAIALRTAPIYRQPPRAYSARLLFGSSPIGRAIGVVYLFGGGMAMVTCAILLWLARYSAIADWWTQSIVLAKIWSEATGQGHSLEFVLGCLFPWAHLQVWCFLALATIVQLVRNGAPFLDPKSTPSGTSGAYGLLASAVAIMSWLQYYPVACDYHCYWAAVPMLGVFVHLFYSSHTSRSQILRSLVAISVSGLVFCRDINRRIDAIKPHISSLNYPIHNIAALRGMRTSLPEAMSYDEFGAIIDRYLRARPDGTIVTNLTDGLFPALTPRQASYHPFYMHWPVITPRIYPERQAAYDKYVKEHHPIVVGGAEAPDHVLVAKLFFWGYPYTIYAPADSHPTEYVECDGGGACTRQPIN